MASLPMMSYEDAKEILKDSIDKDGGLYNLGWYLSWNPGSGQATLDGVFTVKELWAISVYMKEHE